MKKRQLEMALQSLRPLGTREARLEQYSTPAEVAADVLWEAFSAGDVSGRAVADLGTGNGVFAIGAKLLGAQRVLGIDLDPEAIRVAERNAQVLSLGVEFVAGSVDELSGSFDTVIQNPPFGAQTRHADRAFIRKALELAPRTYSLHNDGTQGFVSKLVSSLGGGVRTVKRYKFEIPYAFEFHRKATETISVVLLRFDR
ncbi:MAG: methyltransferase [Candidatus Thermoplasmatota archaeon]|nr:methyltransferase [Candidatus Thermoplasmatota archaeon]